MMHEIEYTENGFWYSRFHTPCGKVNVAQDVSIQVPIANVTHEICKRKIWVFHTCPEGSPLVADASLKQSFGGTEIRP